MEKKTYKIPDLQQVDLAVRFSLCQSNPATGLERENLNEDENWYEF